MLNNEREMDHKERAKAVVAEIVRQAGGRFRGKTNLNKAFWKAHQHYAATNGAYLTLWPIVKLPNGPAIDDVDSKILSDLLREGVLTVEDAPAGPYSEVLFDLRAEDAYRGVLSEDECAAVAVGLSWVRNHTATQNSHRSHQESLSWRRAERNGARLDVMLDSLNDQQYDDAVADMDEIERLAASMANGRS